MAAGREQPKEPPASGAPLRGAIDSGETRDKVPGSDPAASPLGTDDEAAGTPISARQSEAAIRQETGRGSAVPPEPASTTTTGAGPRVWVWMVGAILVLIVLLLVAL
jgi:hypothetical protein